jgi:hypothetical protein
MSSNKEDQALHKYKPHLCHHECEQRIAGDVEGHAQAHVCTALVQLARELAVGHIELVKQQEQQQNQRQQQKSGHARTHIAVVLTETCCLHKWRSLAE